MPRFVEGMSCAFGAFLFASGCHGTKAAPDAATADPCASVRCEMGTHCEVRPAECDSPPCGKRGECAPDPDENPCNVVDCAAGQVCVVESGKATCASGSDESEDETSDAASRPDASGASAGGQEPDAGRSSCAVTLCPPKTMCDDLGGQVRCTPLPSCDGTTCDPGMRCALVEVQCIRAPCPPLPRCVKAQ